MNPLALLTNLSNGGNREMALQVFGEKDLQVRRELQKQRAWIADTLANDEGSTDAELVDYFAGNGVSRHMAEYWVSKRGEYLKDL